MWLTNPKDLTGFSWKIYKVIDWKEIYIWEVKKLDIKEVTETLINDLNII